MSGVNTILVLLLHCHKVHFLPKRKPQKSKDEKKSPSGWYKFFFFYGAVPDPSHIPCSCQHSPQCKQALTEVFMLGDHTEPCMRRLPMPKLDRMVEWGRILHWDKEISLISLIALPGYGMGCPEVVHCFLFMILQSYTTSRYAFTIYSL